MALSQYGRAATAAVSLSQSGYSSLSKSTLFARPPSSYGQNILFFSFFPTTTSTTQKTCFFSNTVSGRFYPHIYNNNNKGYAASGPVGPSQHIHIRNKSFAAVGRGGSKNIRDRSDSSRPASDAIPAMSTSKSCLLPLTVVASPSSSSYLSAASWRAAASFLRATITLLSPYRGYAAFSSYAYSPPTSFVVTGAPYLIATSSLFPCLRTAYTSSFSCVTRASCLGGASCLTSTSSFSPYLIATKNSSSLSLSHATAATAAGLTATTPTTSYRMTTSSSSYFSSSLSSPLTAASSFPSSYRVAASSPPPSPCLGAASYLIAASLSYPWGLPAASPFPFSRLSAAFSSLSRNLTLASSSSSFSSFPSLFVRLSNARQVTRRGRDIMLTEILRRAPAGNNLMLLPPTIYFDRRKPISSLFTPSRNISTGNRTFFVRVEKSNCLPLLSGNFSPSRDGIKPTYATVILTAPSSIGGAYGETIRYLTSLQPPSSLWMMRRCQRFMGARTRRQREEMERKAEQQRSSQLTSSAQQQSSQPATYNSSYYQQIPPAGANTGLSLGWQLTIAFLSSIAFYIGFVTMMRFFGGHRVVAVHVDPYGRPVDPTTGQPRY